MKISDIRIETWPLRQAFNLSRGSYSEISVVVAEVSDSGFIGRGECRPYARYGESPDKVAATMANLKPAFESGMDRQELAYLLPPGAARNALDCALWDLECKLNGIRAWHLAHVSPPDAVLTAYTLSVDTPENLAEAAKENAARPLLKLKLAGVDDLARVAAVRANAPMSRLIVDVNEGWNPDDYLALAPELAGLGVEMLEQPFPAGDDDWLISLPRPLPVCADESCHTTADLQGLVGLYDVVNIKLDKTGGLTEALKMKAMAAQLGFRCMVGCMVGTSLAMAPAVLLAQEADYVDLDGPLWLAQDREDGLVYEGSMVNPPEVALWG